jgi:uncharacterized protein (DUF1499 family)
MLLGLLFSLGLLVACSSMADPKLSTVMSPIKISPCPDNPRCVSTESKISKQRMQPIRYTGNPEDAQERLHQIIKGMPRTTIKADVPGYLSAEFDSRLVRFTDDVEFMFDPEDSIIHFRSGARVGYYDFGVNRARMEYIIKAFHVSDEG